MKYIGNYKEFNLDLVEKRKTNTQNTLVFEPGKIEYAHTDQFLSNNNNPLKYIMFLTDWEIGHIFSHGDNMLSDYKSGDLYQVDDNADTVFCIANIGYTTSSMLEILLHDGE